MCPPPKMDINAEYLQAELVRIDVLIQQAVRRWRLAGQDPADTFRGLYVPDAEAGTLLRRPFGASWGQTVTLEPEEAHAFADAYVQASHRAQSLAEKAQRQGQIPRLAHLATTFGLDRFDLDTFLICLAPTLDLRYERLYGYLQDDVTRRRPRVNLALDLLCKAPYRTRPQCQDALGLAYDAGPSDRGPLLLRFSDDAPLFKYHLLERTPASGPDQLPLLSQVLSVDPAIVSWLLGGYQPHADLGVHASLIQPDADEGDALHRIGHGTMHRIGLGTMHRIGLGTMHRIGLGTMLAANVRVELTRIANGREPPLVVFHGPDLRSQQAASRLLAAQVGRPLLAVDLAAVVDAGVPPLRALGLALRDARLTTAVAYLSNWEACLAEGVRPPPAMLAELCAHPDLAIIAGQRPWQPGGIDRERSIFWLAFPVPAFAQRRAVWQHFLGGADLVEKEDLALLAGQFGLTSGQIRDAVASARDTAAQLGRPLRDQDLFSAARAYSNPHLANLARKIVPRYTWSDIILPPDQLALLHEIVATVRGRPVVLEEWGVGAKLASSNGVTVLFSGPPGTGKTMAAEVIAAELGLDLYKIDLSTVVSKYIGETEKNLEKIFHEAQSSNAILFFDEADAIFGKRSEVKDAHDRYANIEISYLLQRMEMYDGVAILATNLRANLDEAFTRRLQFAVDLPFPEQEYRLRIWQTLFPPDVPCDPEIDFSLFARRFKLAGGNIRNIIVSAAYLAAADGARVTMKHLLHGTRRELQKMGRLVNEADMSIH